MIGPAWFNALVEQWFRYLNRRGRAAGTVRTYGSLIRSLGAWLDEHPEIGAPAELRALHLHDWQDEYLQHHPHRRTQNLAATAARSFLRWGTREGHFEPGLWDRIEPVEVPDTEPLTLEPAPLEVILRHYVVLGISKDLRLLRDRALFLFLLTTGARINEALQLNLVDLDRERWRVIQKGGGQKRLVASERARNWLRDYVRARGRDGERALWVWIAQDGRRRRLNERDVNLIWRRLAAALGVPRFTSRYLRGTASTELQEHGATTAQAARHLGHKGLATVLQYSELRDTHRQQLVDRLDQLIPESPAELPRRRHLRIVKRKRN